ncbi:MAG: hypothetical protein GC154_18785 [bacterium]|nr:hypothetical protein [bacterium]
MKMKKVIVWVVIIGAIIGGLAFWTNKPYTSVQYLGSTTQKGRQNPIIYAASKIFAQRKQLTGNDPYKLYLFADDPDGLKSVKFIVDGKEVKTPFEGDSKTFEKEYDGVTEYGLHTYHLTATDSKGNTSSADAMVNVVPPASTVGVGF